MSNRLLSILYYYDIYFNGNGEIRGTVTELGIPGRYRVRLYAQDTGLLAKEVWSDPLTGAYSFPNLTTTREFFVLTHDHTTPILLMDSLDHVYATVGGTVVNLNIGGTPSTTPSYTADLILTSPYTEPAGNLLVLRSRSDTEPITGVWSSTLTGATAQFTGTTAVYFTGAWNSTLTGATAQFEGVVAANSQWHSTLADATAQFEAETATATRWNSTLDDAAAAFSARQKYNVSADWASTLSPAHSLMDMVFQTRYGFADLVLPEPVLLGGSGTYGYGELPDPVYAATGNDWDNAGATLILPAPELVTRTGAAWIAALPEPVYSVGATSPGFATAGLECPEPTLTGQAWTGNAGVAALECPAPVGAAFSGSYASLELLAPELTAQGRTASLATAALTLPFLELTATGKSGAVAVVTLELPAHVLTATGIVGGVGTATLVLPALILTSAGPDAITETTYTVNLTTGAVTQLVAGAFNRLVTAHGRLYGLQGTALVRLGGETDGGQPIAATVRFAPQHFGTLQAKRMSTAYLNAREDDGLTLDVIADEKTAWRYQTPTDGAPAMGTHKIKTGRGVVFHSAGLQLRNRNGGRMDVGGMELLIEPLSRRPR
jgi:hypothetical protein